MKVRVDTFHIHCINTFVESNLIYARTKLSKFREETFEFG